MTSGRWGLDCGLRRNDGRLGAMNRAPTEKPTLVNWPPLHMVERGCLVFGILTISPLRQPRRGYGNGRASRYPGTWEG